MSALFLLRLAFNPVIFEKTGSFRLIGSFGTGQFGYQGSKRTLANMSH